ncbi:MAG: hypothetical protein LBP83_07720 [Dysgonamonadaceae bacterium]|jgi:lysophospholipase L1-like esterase|nr:hypothetical protein [Dysgonamonadaceae bacterium]
MGPATNRKYKKQWIFKTVAILLPFLILGIIETGLRIFGYGYNTNLFVESQTGRFYYLNPEISQKYFTVSENTTLGNSEFFLKDKKPGTIRFFVLGASSSIGFPYLHNGAFPRLLKYRLQLENPEVNFEIINLSITAVNSYTLSDFAGQLVDYEPDAILIYAGHNEYYGALGVASSSNLGNNPKWIRATLALKNLKIGQCVFRLAARIKGTDKKTTDYSRTLMERMTRKQSIPYNSALFHRGIDQFDANMTRLLQTFSKNGIPVFISSLVYNQKDLKPFVSSTDSLNANEQHELGNAAYNKGNYIAAKAHYNRAKEYDELRFRAPQKINQLIEQYAASMENVYGVDAMQTFEAHSPHAILDSTLMLEHVHPNLYGQRLISDAFYEEIKVSGILPETPGNRFFISVKPSDYPFTAFDTIFGRISTWLLKELWPFNEPIAEERSDYVRTYEEQIAGACAVKQITWKEAMQDYLYPYYIQMQDNDQALRIVEGLCLEYPYRADYFLEAGRLCRQQKQEGKAWFYSMKAAAIASFSNSIEK